MLPINDVTVSALRLACVDCEAAIITALVTFQNHIGQLPRAVQIKFAEHRTGGALDQRDLLSVRVFGPEMDDGPPC